MHEELKNIRHKQKCKALFSLVVLSFCVFLISFCFYVALDLLEASFYLHENTKLLLIGKNRLVSFSLGHGLVKDWEYAKFGSNPISHHAWLDNSRLYLGDRSSHVHVFDIDRRRIESVIDIKQELADANNVTIKQLVKTSNGFCCVLGTNRIHVYFQNGLNAFKLRYFVSLPTYQNNNSSTARIVLI